MLKIFIDYEVRLMEKMVSLVLLAFLFSLSTGATPILHHDISPQPVIIDTDIGSYMDDPVAIIWALSLPSIDVKLITTASGVDTTGRAIVTAKILTMLGRDDIPIGIGVPSSKSTPHTFWNWTGDYNDTNYKGCIYQDGVAAMANVILKSNTVVDIICIGPMTNFPDLLRRFPNVTNNVRIKAMAGSVYKGYNNSDHPSKELNIAYCIECAIQVFKTQWASPIYIAPVDTSGLVQLPPLLVEDLFSCSNERALLMTDMLAYYCSLHPPGSYECDLTVAKLSPMFFDPVAVLISLNEASKYIELDDVKLTVTVDGYTQVDSAYGVPVKAGLHWVNNNGGLDMFMRYLIDSICT